MALNFKFSEKKFNLNKSLNIKSVKTWSKRILIKTILRQGND